MKRNESIFQLIIKGCKKPMKLIMTVPITLIVLLNLTNGYSQENLTTPLVMKSKYYPLPIVNMWTFYELGGETKWIGPSAESLLNDTKSNAKAHAMAQNVRKWGRVKMVSLPLMLTILPAVPVYNELSEPAGIGLVLTSVASLITFVIANGKSNAYVERAANIYNETKTQLRSEHPIYAHKIQVNLEF
jgi:hypothetical protein